MKHLNIKFTCKIESRSRLSFPDTLIIKDKNEFQTAACKKTSKRLYKTKWNCFIIRKYKATLINNLPDRF